MELSKIKWDDIPSLKLQEKKERIAVRNYFLNKQPPAQWLKKHPIYKNTYLPIDKVELLLTTFFGQWRVEIKNISQILNSIVVEVRLHYWDDEINDYSYQDGAGAAALQVDSGAKPMDIEKLKQNAVMLATPIAKTNAVKDAADLIGRAFGRDLNRNDTINYESILNEKITKILDK